MICLAWYWLLLLSMLVMGCLGFIGLWGGYYWLVTHEDAVREMIPKGWD